VNDWFLWTYHHLPWHAKNIAASVRGAYLRQWRYGPETQKLIEAAVEREQWSQKQWSEYKLARLRHVLERAVQRVPYYRQYWSERRRKGQKGSWEYLENWPILEKKTVRENPAAFLADDCDVRRMLCEYTSGTTGMPLSIWTTRKTQRSWFALFEARWRQWNGVSRGDRWAILGGQLVTAAERRRPPFWVWNSALNQLYMSSYHLSPEFIPYYLDALEKHRITYLWGYSSSLHAIAQEALRLNRRLQMKVAITNAEPLFEYQRETISAAFSCPARETYGMCEMVAAASECKSDQLHFWPEVGLVEVDTSPLSSAEAAAGDLICTGLLNADMPLIRYRVGDRGIMDGSSKLCSCGRSLPVLSSMEGRIDDLLYAPDGRVFGRLDPVFKGNLPIRAAQIIQESLGEVRVRYVPTAEFNQEAAKSITREIKLRMGKVNVRLEEVEEIPAQANGKFRAVISQLTPEEKRMCKQKGAIEFR
jgi:phenylacetate-CoA ligase